MNKKRSIMALALLLPAPTIGVIAGMILMPDHFAGKAIFFASKIWIVLLPAVWRLIVERRAISLSPPGKGGFVASSLLGLGLSAFVIAAYATGGKSLLNPERISRITSEIQLATPAAFICAAAYWIVMNSLIEEYVWRWFVVEKFEDVLPGRWPVVASALAFTVHHIVAMQVYFSATVTTLAAGAIFVAGATWSWCYVRYRSIWPGYVSHAIVDLAVFAIAYRIVFA